MNTNFETLENEIKYYSQKYYEGNPEISDEQFDALVDKLRKLKPDSEILQATGWGFETQCNKIKHKYSHIGSLDKAKSFDEIPDRFKNKKIYPSPKLDGLSAVAYYENGKLVRGITRGNGTFGKDITAKLNHIIGSSIKDTTFTGAVRGELVISNTNWKCLKEKDESLIAPRNVAAGIMNRDIIDEDIKCVDMVVYKVTGQDRSTLIHRHTMLQWLSTNFVHFIPDICFENLTETVWSNYHKQLYDNFLTLDYGLDGIVLSSEQSTYNAASCGYIYDEVAFKFASESIETEVLDIEWTMSRTQRYVPVAIVKPVQLAGAIINRATCNNAKMVKDFKIGKGGIVELTRSNEVIPYILGVTDTSDDDLPTSCPYCNSNLQWCGVDLKCVSPNCPNIELSNLHQWCEIMGETDGLAWSLMKQYLDIYNVDSIISLYDKKDIILHDLQSRTISITESKILSFFKKLFIEPVPIEKFLLGLNIPRLGDKTVKLLAREEELCMQLLQSAVDNNVPTQVKDKLLLLVKEATTTEIINNIHKFLKMVYCYNSLHESRIVYPASVNTSETINVAVTGSLQTMKRDAFEKYIESYGYELCSNLKKCKYLITNNADSGSSKNKQAIEYGVTIITEGDFLNLIK